MTGFDSFDEYLQHARVSGLTLSVDGTRLVATVGELNGDGNAFVSALWEIDPAGVAEPRRLTRSAKGESGAAFHPDGSLLFVSGRDAQDEADPPALWRLPPVGEAERVLTSPGGVAAVTVADQAGLVLVTGSALPGTEGAKNDAERREARKKAKTSAVLHRGTPIRFWDHDLGPHEVRLYLLSSLDRPSRDAAAVSGSVITGDAEPTDLTPTPGRALDEVGCAISPDGRTVVTTWNSLATPGEPVPALVAIDTASGERLVLAEGPDVGFSQPAISPDGQFAICVREQSPTYDIPPRMSLWLVDLTSGEGRELVTDPDIWPSLPQFGADAGTVFFSADEQGHGPVFRLDVASETITRVTAAGHYANVQISPDGMTLYALRDAWDSPPRPVRLDATVTDGEPTYLPAPGAATVPGRLERLSATADDGAEVGAWLALPTGASAEAPAPLLLFMHGGPLGSWNSWTWRWNPWLMTARGYAVLLPDPALSTGYGAEMIARGWGQWGGAPFTDLMTVTDAVVARPDIDETRTAAMGGSYGGYLANWVAGHTDRFRAIVTHASIWDIDQFQGTTDWPGYWVREWGLPSEVPERYLQWSPHRYLDRIRTPMLVIHGDKDYRVPVSEALRLWWDLQRTGVESSYLYFPDEGHWILKPGNARVWYETVWAFLAQHVLGEDWVQPELL